MTEIKGIIERIVYKNRENGYTVFSLQSSGESLTCVGILGLVEEGQYVCVKGEMVSHPIYDEQLKVESVEIAEPEDKEAMRRYLGSGAIKGIGPKLADRIVEKFGDDTYRIIEEEPEQLSKVRGISESKAMEIASVLEEKKDARKAMIFLQKYGIQNSLAVKIYETYGDLLYDILRTNPYKIAEDIPGVGFKSADSIAKISGISEDSEFRIKSACIYVLNQAEANGNACLPFSVLKENLEILLEKSVENFSEYIDELIMEQRVVKFKNNNEVYIYEFGAYNTEISIAKRLHELNKNAKTIKPDFEKINEYILKIEGENNYILDELQKEAVIAAATNGVSILTGGPGTGKTTTVNAIIKYFDKQGENFKLAAPTGRAAKRLSETTGFEASTIHRLLGINSDPDSNANMYFDVNEDNPLDAGVVIVDETSMVDMYLMNSLLKALEHGTKLILVGDADQLPSVGPGNVLKDLIESNEFKTIRLTKIFRQAEQSEIVMNAHKINSGDNSIVVNNKDGDFFIMRMNNAVDTAEKLKVLIKDNLPKFLNEDPFDIQVLTPMKKGVLGAISLNTGLQEFLNPSSPDKREITVGETLFREGDKVMQVKNNYNKEWNVYGLKGFMLNNGTGVFNGDMGVIKRINEFEETVDISFDDGRIVSYEYEELNEVELAYAITVHKSQGSEYPAVIIPIFSGPPVLMNRNILYTAITRAKKFVLLMGSRETIDEMIANVSKTIRYSGLCTMAKIYAPVE